MERHTSDKACAPARGRGHDAWSPPERLTWLYLDFDSYFASVEQQRRPELRGRAVGITPSDIQMGGTIAISREAKAMGCSRVGSRREFLQLCPDAAFVAQDPKHYIAIHKAAVEAIERVIPVHQVRGVDEMSIRLDKREAERPHDIARRINAALAEAIGEYITASLGFSTNRVLAKMASAHDKPCGVTVWHPRDWPGPLRGLEFARVPGIASRMEKRLHAAGVHSLSEFLDIGPKRARAIWGNVVGERMWHYLQGFDLEDPDTTKSMIGHGRVLPRAWQGLERPRRVARFLTVKAARRMRRGGYCASHFYLAVKFRDPGNTRNVYTRDAMGRESFHRWGAEAHMASVCDDHACLSALGSVWARLEALCGGLRDTVNIAHVQITLSGLHKRNERQGDLFADDRPDAWKWRRLSKAVDKITERYKSSPVMQGSCENPPGGNAGTKIAFNRVPEEADAY